jgi:hypothetical protein
MDLISWTLLATIVLFIIGFGFPLLQLALTLKKDLKKP